MILIRLFLLVFNVTIIGFLIYRMFESARQPIEKSRKVLIITGGIILLLAPFAIFLNFVPATPQYLVIYPVAIALFLYLTKQFSI